MIFYENDYGQALAGLSIADVVLVNPLIDGMNLVAKEAVVVSERDAALVLSETAGAFDQMADGVLPVAPADVVGTADALAAGLAMPARGARRAPRAAAGRRGARGHRLVAAAAAARPGGIAERRATRGAPLGQPMAIRHDRPVRRGSAFGQSLTGSWPRNASLAQ